MNITFLNKTKFLNEIIEIDKTTQNIENVNYRVN